MSKAWEHTNGVLPKELVPQERMGDPGELSGAIIYLASKVSRGNGSFDLPTPQDPYLTPRSTL